MWMTWSLPFLRAPVSQPSSRQTWLSRELVYYEPATLARCQFHHWVSVKLLHRLSSKHDNFLIASDLAARVPKSRGMMVCERQQNGSAVPTCSSDLTFSDDLMNASENIVERVI